MNKVIFLLEEPSMQILLEGLLPRLFPNLIFHCTPHRGKRDLDRSIPAILRDWREPGARFVVVQDNDNGDCYALKDRHRQLCRQGGREDFLVRIVCQELEAWYLGEPNAMAVAFGDERLRRIGRRAQYRNPDTRPKPSGDVEKLVPEFQKIAGARQMAEHLTREGNGSRSFAVFLDGVAGLCASTPE